ncbi:putative transcriptional regulatory protein [Fulvitalea axinellae]|uniref:Probable transcriptional regulatory protein FUAX_13250 n=1 Tax=Fulvitalea axinellae TaxID=1182444 RepID=A0AAU9CFX5_9BACT|nr:putative transcriptional regulatory protein [Fulvitalea axinellae]
MAGHSKWANIKHRKGAQDAKRGKIFTKLIKEITVSVKESGPDADTNPRLRLAIQNAKGQNMPKDTIDRAIKKASGADAADYQEVTFEGYGPKGVAVFVECATDNNNRTVSNVRAAFTKSGGSLGKNGSLEFVFDRKGIFVAELPEGADAEELELELIDGGAEEAEFEEGMVHVTTAVTDFGNMQKKLDELGAEVKEAGLQRIPNNLVVLTDEEFPKIWKLIDTLEDNDDVQKVYHNIDVQESQEEMM